MNVRASDGARVMTQNIVLPATSLVCTKPRAPATPGGVKGLVAGPGSVFCASATNPVASSTVPNVATMSVTNPSVVEVHTRSPALRQFAPRRYDDIADLGTAVATASASFDNGPEAAAR